MRKFLCFIGYHKYEVLDNVGNSRVAICGVCGKKKYGYYDPMYGETVWQSTPLGRR